MTLTREEIARAFDVPVEAVRIEAVSPPRISVMLGRRTITQDQVRAVTNRLLTGGLEPTNQEEGTMPPVAEQDAAAVEAEEMKAMTLEGAEDLAQEYEVAAQHEQDLRRRRNRAILALTQYGHTQQEIATRLGLTRGRVAQILRAAREEES